MWTGAAVYPTGRDAWAKAPPLRAQCAAPPGPRWPWSVCAVHHKEEDDVFTNLRLVRNHCGLIILALIQFIQVGLVSYHCALYSSDDVHHVVQL